VVTLLLAVAKVAMWAATGSLAILSQALDSVVDVVGLGLVFVAVRVADKPADASHHYGHGKAENLAAFTQTLLLMGVVVGVVLEAGRRLAGDAPGVGAPATAIGLMGASALIDVLRVRYLTRAATAERSEALRAGALNLAADVGTALVALASLVAVRAGIERADAIGALIVAVAVTVAAALVMPITIPVPQEYAEKYDRKSPSTYDQYTVFTGPYMVRNDPDGKVVGRDPGKLIELVRNPNWDEATDYKPAYLDEIRIEEGNDDLTVASRRTLQGDGLMCCDSGQPPIAVLRRAITTAQDQLGRVSSGGTRWITLRADKKPFDNLNVRKAVIAGMDREALLKTRGGREVGPIAQGYIPPGVPGFEESGGEKGFPEFDFMQHPQGDPELAKEYMLKAKAEGVPVDDEGRYTGSEKLLTIATNADPGLQTATVAQSQLQEMGFELNFRKVPQDTLYTRFCNVPASGFHVCPNVGWFRDFTDPQSLLEPTFKGAAIKPQGNVNYGMLDVPEIDDAMTKAATIPAGPERNKAWADINRMIVGQAPGIPYSWDDSFQLASKDVQGVMNGYTTTWDFTYSSVK
jgi:peptide/nickel transport system substrate-binding protein